MPNTWGFANERVLNTTRVGCIHGIMALALNGVMLYAGCTTATKLRFTRMRDLLLTTRQIINIFFHNYMTSEKSKVLQKKNLIYTSVQIYLKNYFKTLLVKCWCVGFIIEIFVHYCIFMFLINVLRRGHQPFLRDKRQARWVSFCVLWSRVS